MWKPTCLWKKAFWVDYTQLSNPVEMILRVPQTCPIKGVCGHCSTGDCSLHIPKLKLIDSVPS